LREKLAARQQLSKKEIAVVEALSGMASFFVAAQPTRHKKYWEPGSNMDRQPLAQRIPIGPIFNASMDMDDVENAVARLHRQGGLRAQFHDLTEDVPFEDFVPFPKTHGMVGALRISAPEGSIIRPMDTVQWRKPSGRDGIGLVLDAVNHGQGEYAMHVTNGNIFPAYTFIPHQGSEPARFRVGN
jgi:hypothetical protein